MYHAWRELLPCAKGPLLCPSATRDTLQHTFNTSFVCHFYLCLPRETTATGAPRLIFLPHVNQQHQIISTQSFGTCSHNVCWVGLVPGSPMKRDLLLKLQFQSSNTKEGTLIALHLVFLFQLQVLHKLKSSFSAMAALQISNLWCLAADFPQKLAETCSEVQESFEITGQGLHSWSIQWQTLSWPLIHYLLPGSEKFTCQYMLGPHFLIPKESKAVIM